MTNSYEDMMGTAMDPGDHPSHNVPQASQHYAGDVLPLRPNSPTVNDYAADRQIINQRSLENIANKGPSAVDPKNLAIFKRK